MKRTGERRRRRRSQQRRLMVRGMMRMVAMRGSRICQIMGWVRMGSQF